MHGLLIPHMHADDIRTAATHRSDQVVTVDHFTKKKGLQLCAEKKNVAYWLLEGMQMSPLTLWLRFICIPFA